MRVIGFMVPPPEEAALEPVDLPVQITDTRERDISHRQNIANYDGPNPRWLLSIFQPRAGNVGFADDAGYEAAEILLFPHSNEWVVSLPVFAVYVERLQFCEERRVRPVLRVQLGLLP